MKKDYLYLTGIYAASGCISVQYAFKYKKRYYDYLKAFDDESPFSKYRPGKALLLLLIEEAIENNYNAVDLLRGHEQYKFEIANDWHYVNVITISNPVNKFYLRHMLFSLLLFGVYIKYSLLKEIHLIQTQIRNYGVRSLIKNYIPDFLTRLKNKATRSEGILNKKPLKIVLPKTTALPISIDRKKKEVKLGNV